MIRRDWAETLFEIWKDCRDRPHWDDLAALHDSEDRRYFDMLDEERAKGRIHVPTV